MMRAKMQLTSLVPIDTAGQVVNITMQAVCGKSDQDGNSDDNTYARYTPCANLEMTVANPTLAASLKVGQTFYVDFSEIADESPSDAAPASDTAPLPAGDAPSLPSEASTDTAQTT